MTPQTTSVPLDDWLAMHRQNGWMTGALEGWLHWDGTPEHMARLRETTRAFLGGAGMTAPARITQADIA